MARFGIRYRLAIPLLAEAGLILLLTGLFFPIKAAQSSGIAGIVLAALLALAERHIVKQHALWFVACILMLACGAWGMQVAPDPKMSWTAFWSYQTIGKGFLCALALLCVPFSSRQVQRLLLLLLLLLIARNVEMFVYGFQHPVFLGGKELANEEILLGYRSQGDHIVLLSPFVLAAMLVRRQEFAVSLALLGIEMALLASTGWRGAWLGFAGSCLCLLVYFRAWRALSALFVAVTLVGVVGLLASDDNIVALAINRGFSDSNRIEKVWLPALDILSQANWQGYGFGQARYIELLSAYSAMHPDKAIPIFGDAHNMVLNFAMSAGWLGVLAFVAVLGVGVAECFRRLRENGLAPEQIVLLSGTSAGWLGVYGLLGLTDQPHYNNLAVLAVLTSVGLASYPDRKQV